MFKNYIKTAFRQLVKHRLFSVINIVGLSAGFASLMTLSVLVYQFLTTNSNLPGISQMYYLGTSTPDGGHHMLTTYPLLGEIIRECPEVDAGTHMQQWYYPWLKYGDREFQETTDFVDSGFFRVFQFPFQYGNPATALNDKYNIVLSQETAEKMFGKSNPLGKVITADDTVKLTVTGVLKHIPTNSTVRPTVLLSTALLEDNPDFKGTAGWYNVFTVNYLRLKKGSDPGKMNAEISAIVKLNYAPELKKDVVRLMPFAGVTRESGDLTGVIMKGAAGAGFMILLIILVNLINLNMASSYSRAREVAVRQVLGGTKRHMITQFCFENGMIVLISVGLSWLIFSLVLLPMINGLVGSRIGDIEPDGSMDVLIFVFFGVLGSLFTLLSAGLSVSRLINVPPRDAIKGKPFVGNYRKSTVRNVFITLQFVMAITLVCVALVFSRQIGFMKSFALGFNQQDLAVVKLDLSFLDPASADVRFKSIVNTLKTLPHVKGVSASEAIPTSYQQNYNSYYDPQTGKKITLRYADVDAGYFPTYQIPMIQGKNFSDDLAASERSSVIINETAMKAFGWKNAIGKQLKEGGSEAVYTVMGVSGDFHFDDLQHAVQPLLQGYTGPPSLDNRFLSVRIDKGFIKPVMEQLRQSFKTMPSRRDFSYELMGAMIDQQYALFDGMLKAADYVALLTVIIAGMGLFGLIALFARQRTREIGIRKVLGANVIRILRLLSGDFLLLVGIGVVIGAPVGWYIMSRWLQDFACRITMSWWIFILAGLLAMLLAVIMVGFQTVKTAMANPVNALRTE